MRLLMTSASALGTLGDGEMWHRPAFPNFTSLDRQAIGVNEAW